MTLKLRLPSVVAALWCGFAPGAAAHIRMRAVMAFESSGPASGEACRVTVRFATLAGSPVDLEDVKLVGEMTGHAMRPVEAALEPRGQRGEYRGELEFTMAGPWRLTINANDGHGTVTGVAEISVAAENGRASADTAAGQAAWAGPIAVDLEAPAPAPPWSPWKILIVALGLTAAAEAVAVARKLSQVRRSSVRSGSPAARTVSPIE